MTDTREKLDVLKSLLRGYGSVCVGYSGGVDSVYLAKLAVDVLGAENVLAVTGISPSYPQVQREVAARCARAFGIPHLEVDTHEVDDPRYAQNPSNRCYFCKSELWPRLQAVASEHGLAVLLDGSNADDAHDYRPGFAAAREHGVRAPLLEAGMTKEDVRALSRAAGLPTWDQPAAPCLSSRLPYGIVVTRERLQQVEQAEAVMRELGFREFRVRHHDDCARIELNPEELPRALQHAEEIRARVAATGLERVLFDAEGYRRGALNEALVQLGGARSDEPAELPAHEVAGFHRDIAVLRGTGLSTARKLAPALRAAGFRYIAIDPASTGA
jgi:uncharacterized protein